MLTGYNVVYKIGLTIVSLNGNEDEDKNFEGHLSANEIYVQSTNFYSM